MINILQRVLIAVVSLFVFVGILLIPVGEPLTAVAIEKQNAAALSDYRNINDFGQNEPTTQIDREVNSQNTKVESKEVETKSVANTPEKETGTDEPATEFEQKTEAPTTIEETVETTTEKVVETTTKVENTEKPTTQIEKSTISVKTKVSGTTNVYITDNEYRTICCVVMREAGGGSFDGCAAVTQCILDGMLYEGKSATYVLNNYGYYPNKAIERARSIPPSDKVKNAVSAVFYEGYRVTSEMIIVYYAPALCYSEWHEKQVYVCSYDGNKFFKYPGT